LLNVVSSIFLILKTGMSSAYDSNPAVLVITQNDGLNERRSEIIYPARDNIRLERKIILENVKESQIHHQNLINEHTKSNSDTARRENIKREFFEKKNKKNNKNKKLRHKKK